MGDTLFKRLTIMTVKKLMPRNPGENVTEDFELELVEMRAVEKLRLEVHSLRITVFSMQLDQPLASLLKCAEERLKEIIARGKGTLLENDIPP